MTAGDVLSVIYCINQRAPVANAGEGEAVSPVVVDNPSLFVEAVPGQVIPFQPQLLFDAQPDFSGQEQSRRVQGIVRAVSAPLFDIFFRPESEFIPSLDAVDKRRLRLALGRCRIVGFWDALADRLPRSLDWLNEQSMQLV